MASSTKRLHPWRTLGIFFLVVAAMYGLMAISRSWAPKLGLDLRGGTTITLTARNSTGGGSVSSASLELARQILQQRVDSLGVGESNVTTQGGNQIIVTVPNVQKDQLVNMVGQTAQLAFRDVYDAQQVATTPSTTPSSSGSASALPADPGLPPAAPKARPTAPSGKQESTSTLLKWTPSAADTSDFASWTCADSFPDVSDQPLFACDRGGTYKYLLGPVILTGQEVSSASAVVPQNTVTPVVQLSFTSAGQKAFTAATEHLASQTSPQNQFAIVLDGKVISAPSVSQKLTSSAQIEGSFTQAEATDLANVLKYGALPLTFDLSSVENVSATLGGEQLQAGLIAGAIGLILVIAYSFFYYRGLGILVVGSLTMAAVITYSAMVLLGQAVGFALNLPGIAGAIVAVGVTSDSFIVYFERIRDEIRDGRTLRTAIETGWRKARGTITIADCVSLLSAVVLFILAIGDVKGFAFTLGLTTAIDLVIVFFFTKPLMTLLGRTEFWGRGHRWSGLDPEHMGVSRESLLGRRVRRTSTHKEARDVH